MRKLVLPLFIALALGLAGATAMPIFKGGVPSGGGGGGTAYAIDGSSGVRADFATGQAYVTWPDTATGAGGAVYRYRMYRSTAPITSGNYTSATLIASYIFNNSGQLFGGNPDVSGGSTFTQAHRQANDSANPMSIVPDMQLGGTRTLTYGTGLQVYTALGAGTGYYAIVQTDTSNANPVFIGSVGPITESTAPQTPILYAHRTTGIYRVTGTTAGLPMVFQAHASSSAGGTPSNNTFGDYWEWFGDTTQGYQDGRATTFVVLKDGSGGSTQFPDLASSLVIGNRDTVWSTDGLGAMETLHFGQAYTPNPLVGPANKFYPITQNTFSSFIKFAASNYGADLTKLHWAGHSMGAWAGAVQGIRSTDPLFASLWLEFPVWKAYQHGCGIFTGISVWTSTMPFKATVGAAPCTLGSTASAVQFPDGSSWLDYDDTVAWVAAHPEAEIPFVAWTMGKDDTNFTSGPPTNFIEDIQAATAFQTGHHAFVFAWNMGHHDANAAGVYNKDISGADALAYSKTKFGTNLPMLAFGSTVLDDDPGTAARDANGIYDGDVIGCIGCGYTWNFTTNTSSALAFTVGNGWMARSATTIPTTTMAASIPSSGTGSFAATDTSGFLTVAANNFYVRIGNEIVSISSKASNTLAINGRGLLGTTAQAHSAGETVTQYPGQPTGPNGGPQANITVDITPRRSAFVKTDGTTVSCPYSVPGGSSGTLTPTFANGVITLNVPIKSGVSTSVSCS